MKKIVMGIVALACAASMFAVDIAARVVLDGTIADGTIDINGDETKESTLNFWKLSKYDQKDSDALVMSVNGDKSGAQFQMWYKYDGSGSAAPSIRSTSLWFKPIDMLKVTVGDVSVGTYKESIDWWKAPAGEAASAHATYTWSSYATVEGSGISLELTPIDGLWLNAGIAAGADNEFATISFDETENETYKAWGAAAKYDFAGLLGLPLSAAVSYRDAGKDDVKIAAIGAEYGNRWGDGFYGFLNARTRFENFTYTYTDTSTATPAYIGTKHTLTQENALQAVMIDNMVKYQAGAFQVMGRFPVTIRTVKDVAGLAAANGYVDPSWMAYEIKASYAFSGFGVYGDVENDHAVTFDENFLPVFLNMTVKAGVTANFGSVALDSGVQVALPTFAKNDGKLESTSNMTWSVPFNVSIGF
ncbi:MAG: hypothetical protein K5866_02085 [Treponema sp.]|nr:hypothetical protein [Treponema sp.]